MMHQGERYYAPERILPGFERARDRSVGSHGTRGPWVRHGLVHHWNAWDSWGDFFGYWFVHTMGVILIMGIAFAAIIYTHKFFLGYERKESDRELTFYVLMTILVAALGIWVAAHWPHSDDEYDDSCAFVVFAA